MGLISDRRNTQKHKNTKIILNGGKENNGKEESAMEEDNRLGLGAGAGWWSGKPSPMTKDKPTDAEA